MYSFDGSTVIVPNGTLISDQMLNALMEETAQENDAVNEIPRPRAYFLEFGDSSLIFRLLAWVRLDVRLET